MLQFEQPDADTSPAGAELSARDYSYAIRDQLDEKEYRRALRYARRLVELIEQLCRWYATPDGAGQCAQNVPKISENGGNQENSLDPPDKVNSYNDDR